MKMTKITGKYTTIQTTEHMNH